MQIQILFQACKMVGLERAEDLLLWYWSIMESKNKKLCKSSWSIWLKMLIFYDGEKSVSTASQAGLFGLNKYARMLQLSSLPFFRVDDANH